MCALECPYANESSEIEFNATAIILKTLTTATTIAAAAITAVTESRRQNMSVMLRRQSEANAYGQRYVCVCCRKLHSSVTAAGK